jgi:inner membrane protein
MTMLKWTQTATAKVLGIGLLALLMLIPLGQVRDLVAERHALRTQAAAQIAQGWGGQQVLGGVVLAVPTRRSFVRADNTSGIADSHEIVLADTVYTTAAMSVQKRRYGMYEVPVFVADTQIHGRFLSEDLARYRSDSVAEWVDGKAELRLLLSDAQGLQEVTGLKINGAPFRFTSSAARVGGLSVISVPIDLHAYADQPIDFELSMKLAGTESLQVLPLARQSHVTISAPWPDPSFVGAVLPAQRIIDARGFTASWRMLDLNRSYGQHWDAGTNAIDNSLAGSASGVQLYQPANVYQQNERAGKYGLLFVAMTFVAFFLFEVLKKLRVHPVQYLLIGAALATFYVVLLAFSEQIGFGLAYLLASAAVVTIVGGYAAAVLRASRAGFLLGGVLAVVYAVLYGLIGAEQYALVIGACVLLLVLALLMYLTRRIDWYAYGGNAPAAAVPTMTTTDIAMENP